MSTDERNLYFEAVSRLSASPRMQQALAPHFYLDSAGNSYSHMTHGMFSSSMCYFGPVMAGLLFQYGDALLVTLTIKR